MVVDAFYVIGVIFSEYETDPPTLVYGHGPLTPTVTLEPVQSQTPQWAQVARCSSDIQDQQHVDCSLDIETTESVRALTLPNLARG